MTPQDKISSPQDIRFDIQRVIRSIEVATYQQGLLNQRYELLKSTDIKKVYDANTEKFIAREKWYKIRSDINIRDINLAFGKLVDLNILYQQIDLNKIRREKYALAT